MKSVISVVRSVISVVGSVICVISPAEVETGCGARGLVMLDNESYEMSLESDDTCGRMPPGILGRD